MSAFRSVAALAEQLSGLVTTAPAAQVGGSRLQMAWMSGSGSLIRVARTVTIARRRARVSSRRDSGDVAGTEGAEPAIESGVPSVVATGATSVQLHGVGLLRPELYDFIVSRRLTTRRPVFAPGRASHRDVRLPVRIPHSYWSIQSTTRLPGAPWIATCNIQGERNVTAVGTRCHPTMTPGTGPLEGPVVPHPAVTLQLRFEHWNRHIIMELTYYSRRTSVAPVARSGA